MIDLILNKFTQPMRDAASLIVLGTGMSIIPVILLLLIN